MTRDEALAALKAEQQAHAATIVRMQRLVDEATANFQAERTSHSAAVAELAALKAVAAKYDPQIKAEEKAKRKVQADELRRQADALEAVK